MLALRYSALLGVFLHAISVVVVAQTDRQPEPVATSNDLERNTTMNKRIKEGWRQATCKFLRRDEREPVSVTCKRAVYEIEFKEGMFHSVAVTAFLSPQSRIPWLGPEQEYYVETDTGVTGFQMRTGNVLWCESLAKVLGQQSSGKWTVDGLLTAFEENVSGTALFEASVASNPKTEAEHTTDLRPAIKTLWFFADRPFSSGVGFPRIVAAERNNGQLRLDLTNQTGELKAAVLVDIKTRKAVLAD